MNKLNKKDKKLLEDFNKMFGKQFKVIDVNGKVL